jgi:hypothetical protein
MRAGTASEMTAKMPGMSMLRRTASTAWAPMATPMAGERANTAMQMPEPMALSPSSRMVAPGSRLMTRCTTMAPTTSPMIWAGSVMAKIRPRPAEPTP